MSDVSDRWYLKPDFLEDSAIRSSERTPTGKIVFRQTTQGRPIVENLNWLTLEPGGAKSEDLTFEYTGYYPIQIEGIYLRQQSTEEYIGTTLGRIDIFRILRWGREGQDPNDADLNTKPGLHLKQTKITENVDNEGVRTLVETAVWTRFKSGTNGGASHNRPIPVELHPDMPAENILTPGDRIPITLKLVLPQDSTGEILKVNKIGFGIDISFIEISPDVGLKIETWQTPCE
jgi:hypothetical protein